MAAPVTPSTASKASGPGPLNSQKSTNIQGVRLVMRANSIPFEDQAAIRHHPEIRKHAEEIIIKVRNSPVKPEWEDNIISTRDTYGVRNETTWIIKFWNALQNPERNIKEKDEHGSILEPEQWTSVAWKKSFLDDNWNADLRAGSVPILHTEDPNIQELLDSLPRITNPRPDIAFGLTSEAFSEDENVVNDRYQLYAQVSQGIYHSWLLVETKVSGPIEDAENQCCRGGASLVCAARTMICDADPDAVATSYGPDFESIAFSVALVPTCANIFCHWAEVRSDEKVVYHMHMIKTFALRDKEQIIGFQRAINNILDWGTNDRLMHMKAVLRKLHNRAGSTGKNKRKKVNEKDGDDGEG